MEELDELLRSDDTGLKRLIDFLNKNINKNSFDKELNDKIIYLRDMIIEVYKSLNIEELEKLYKIEVELEVNCEELYELSNYFDPVYKYIKDRAHTLMVRELRNRNRKNREEKCNDRF